jgi:hypothetical protein
MLPDPDRMPEFEDRGEGHPERFVEADAWKVRHAPPPRKKSAAAIAAAGVAGVSDASDAGKGKAAGEGESIDVTKYRIQVDDFDAWVISEAENIVQETLGLYREACKGGNSARIGAAFDNWQAATKRCREIRQSFIELRERAANVITVDKAADIVGRELGVLQALLDDFDVRVAPAANPEAPHVARDAIRAGLVEVFQRLDIAGGALDANAEESAA